MYAAAYNAVPLLDASIDAMMDLVSSASLDTVWRPNVKMPEPVANEVALEWATDGAVKILVASLLPMGKCAKLESASTTTIYGEDEILTNCEPRIYQDEDDLYRLLEWRGDDYRYEMELEKVVCHDAPTKDQDRPKCYYDCDATTPQVMKSATAVKRPATSIQDRCLTIVAFSFKLQRRPRRNLRVRQLEHRAATLLNAVVVVAVPGGGHGVPKNVVNALS